MNEDEELSLDELTNVLGGIPHEMAEEKALENNNLYRKTYIEKLKKEKEALLAAKEHENNTSGRGR